jgi:hypothetical protein
LQADAEAIGALALAMFGTVRFRGNVALPITSPLLQLGDDMTMENCGALNGDYLDIGLIDEWDGEVPLVECEVWG